MEKNERPLIITILCVCYALASIAFVLLIFSPAARTVAAWYPLHMGMVAALRMTSVVAWWQMRRWGIYLFAGTILLDQGVLLTTHHWTIVSLVLPLVVLQLVAVFHNKMR